MHERDHRIDRESSDLRALDQQPLGQGALDIGAILDATPSCEFDVVEFDYVDGDVFDAVSESIVYLERRRGN